MQDILDDLSPAECISVYCVYFSVATDASNKGNRKMFPVSLCLMECGASYWTFMKTVMKRLMAFIKH